ncbi:MAG: radical SAM protein [Desulfovibrio sp.]
MRLPEQLYVNATNKCNYRCTYCPYHSPLWSPRLGAPGFTLRLDDLRRQLDAFADPATGGKLANVTFTGMGEPMLNPEILEMIALVKERGLTCSLTSNFSRLLTPHIDRLMDLGLDGLYTNLDSGESGHYEELRRGASFDTTLGNIRAVINASALRNPKLNFEVHNLVTPQTADLLPRFIETVAEAGVRKVIVKTFVNFLDTDVQGKFFDHIAEERKFFDLVLACEERGKELGVRVQYPAYFALLAGRRGYDREDPALRCSIGSCLHLNFGPLEYSEDELLGNVVYCCPIMAREGYGSFGKVGRNSGNGGDGVNAALAALAHPARRRLLDSLESLENLVSQCRKCEYFFQGLHERYARMEAAS